MDGEKREEKDLWKTKSFRGWERQDWSDNTMLIFLSDGSSPLPLCPSDVPLFWQFSLGFFKEDTASKKVLDSGQSSHHSAIRPQISQISSVVGKTIRHWSMGTFALLTIGNRGYIPELWCYVAARSMFAHRVWCDAVSRHHQGTVRVHCVHWECCGAMICLHTQTHTHTHTHTSAIAWIYSNNSYIVDSLAVR